jgi:centrosomal CEP192-like protein
MHMFEICFHRVFKNNQAKQNSSLTFPMSHPNSFLWLCGIKLANLALALIVLGGCIALTGCGGIVAPGASGSGGKGVIGTSGLTVNSSTVSFGNVAVGTPSTQPVTLTSSGTGAVTVSAVSLSGTGFALSGATFPLTLDSGQTATLSLQFEPAATGTATGKLTITSNASANSSDVVTLTGTGVPLAVDLSWSPPASSEPIAGYNIYRAAASASSFARLNASVNSPASFMDSTVKAGATYQYYVTSVDSSGAESTPSNTATVVVP